MIENAIGGAGADTLMGNAAANVLPGGGGDDTYAVGAGDTVIENADEGTDTVRSAVSYTLGTNVEALTLTGAGNLNGTGNSANNLITGNAGNNVLDGAGGVVTMTGGAGNGTYYVESVGEVVGHLRAAALAPVTDDGAARIAVPDDVR